MNEENYHKKESDTRIKFWGGPHGLGDPEDLQLRKVEKDILIPIRLKEEATKKCSNLVRRFLDCAERTGFAVVIKCRAEHKDQELCLAKWMKDEQLVKEVTEKYLYERSYYRRTGKPLNPPKKRTKMEKPSLIEEAN